MQPGLPTPWKQSPGWAIHSVQDPGVKQADLLPRHRLRNTSTNNHTARPTTDRQAAKGKTDLAPQTTGGPQGARQQSPGPEERLQGEQPQPRGCAFENRQRAGSEGGRSCDLPCVKVVTLNGWTYEHLRASACHCSRGPSRCCTNHNSSPRGVLSQRRQVPALRPLPCRPGKRKHINSHMTSRDRHNHDKQSGVREASAIMSLRTGPELSEEAQGSDLPAEGAQVPGKMLSVRLRDSGQAGGEGPEGQGGRSRVWALCCLGRDTGGSGGKDTEAPCV